MNRFLKIVALGFLLSLPWISEASAQQVNLYCQVSAGPPQIWAPCSSSNALNVTTTITAYPTGATAVTGNGTGTTGAVVGTLAGTSAKTTYICGFNDSAVGTGAIGPITVAGLITSSMVFQLTAAAAGAQLTVPFLPCVPASAVNTSITVTTSADGSASAVDVNSWGYQL